VGTVVLQYPPWFKDTPHPRESRNLALASHQSKVDDNLTLTTLPKGMPYYGCWFCSS